MFPGPLRMVYREEIMVKMDQRALYIVSLVALARYKCIFQRIKPTVMVLQKGNKIKQVRGIKRPVREVYKWF
jgi:hypothetical protein